LAHIAYGSTPAESIWPDFPVRHFEEGIGGAPRMTGAARLKRFNRKDGI
jgi:hypothetical protein